MFQHTAARRRLGKPSRLSAHHTLFQHTAARRRLELQFDRTFILIMFQHTAARRRLVQTNDETGHSNRVSTHSRPKAAGADNLDLPRIKHLFQHTAARRRLGTYEVAQEFYACVSTHSRPKAAGSRFIQTEGFFIVSTHSRPKAAGKSANWEILPAACFNTQPPEGGWFVRLAPFLRAIDSFNTQPPEGGWDDKPKEDDKPKVSTHSRLKAAGFCALTNTSEMKFQHTAARRRLARCSIVTGTVEAVSTHSRPKAAGPFVHFI